MKNDTLILRGISILMEMALSIMPQQLSQQWEDAVNEFNNEAIEAFDTKNV